MSRGQSQSRDQPVRRTLEKCKTTTIEIIDVDQGKVDVVTVDAAETSHQGSRVSRTTKGISSPVTVISIDDEDGVSIRNARAGDIGKEFCPASSSSLSEESQSDECLMFIKRVHPPLNSMESIKIYDDVGPSVNRFGLGISSASCSSESDNTESDSSESIGSDADSDNSDCEILEDSSGNIRELWERAALKRKMSDRVRFSSEDQSNTSGSSADGGLPSEAATQNRVELVNCRSKLYPSRSEEMPVKSCLFHSNNGKEHLSLDRDAEVDNFSGKMNADSSDIGIKEPAGTLETCAYNEESRIENLPDNIECAPQDSEIAMNTSVCDLNLQHDPKIIDCGTNSLDVGEQDINATDSGCNRHSTACDLQPLEGKDSCPVSNIHDVNKHSSVEPSSHMPLKCASYISSGTAGFQEKDATSQQPSSSNNELPAHSDLIGERERHKESDEYRRAVKEEWAARQLQLRIQAEEAQKLRRRRKAETLRLLDMERRQKQRLEEVRESQKKDEETINLKEQIRAEVRKDLEKMEQRYRDMSSLLRALGIHVGGGHFPRPHEVNSAYKQALLRFHPDRASRSDIREQVKAEETFKLISRLKDKL